MDQITTVAADLAKELIVVCAADASGRTLYFKQFGFRGFAEWAANLPPCTIAMEGEESYLGDLMMRFNRLGVSRSELPPKLPTTRCALKALLEANS